LRLIRPCFHLVLKCISNASATTVICVFWYTVGALFGALSHEMSHNDYK